MIEGTILWTIYLENNSYNYIYAFLLWADGTSSKTQRPPYKTSIPFMRSPILSL